MKKITCIILAALLSIAFIADCFAQEGVYYIDELIKKANAYVKEGNKEKAVPLLDAAFKLADVAGDYEALMEIGDLYIAADPTLREKALNAWTAAGTSKLR